MPLFRKKARPFFSPEENERIVSAIKQAETLTTGEIRIYIESRCRDANPLHHAAALFHHLKMQHTAHRNGVLIYLATQDHKLALFADEGIYQKFQPEHWLQGVEKMLHHCRNNNHAEGLVNLIQNLGKMLGEHFPPDANSKRNELPDDIIFGK